MKTALQYCFLLLTSVLGISANAQDTTNAGKEFWVGYGLHQFMTDGSNTQTMTIYLSTGSQAATVTVTIDSSSALPSPTTWWSRTYNIPANTVIDIETATATSYTTAAGASGPIPKGVSGQYDTRLYSAAPPTGTNSTGKFRKKAIHIESNVPIVAYSHTYGSASSGATLLLPVESWGGLYTSANSKQSYSAYSYSWLYIIAKYDNTVVEVTPSVKTVAQNLTGLQPGVTSIITLMRGQIYQVLAAYTASDADGNGGSSTSSYELTGTKVKSVLSPTGYIHPIAVFSGSSRTTNPASCVTGGGDNDMQQHYPRQAMGKVYLTAPFSGSTTPSNPATCIYKIVVNDPSTVVTKNGVTLSGLVNNTYYTYESNTADLIQADQPILVAQFMTGGGCLGDGAASLGDPEMIYLNPLSQAITDARFFRNTKQAITVNYVTLILPTAGLATLTIDGSSTFDYTYAHPNMAGYSVVVKRWTAAQAQATIQSTVPFTGITYGLGNVESYGYSLGTKLNAVNARDASVLPPGFTGVLPVTLLNFSASKNASDVILKWNTSYEINFDRFEVERSLNGTEFSRFATVNSAQSNSAAYTTTDINALKLFAAQPTIYYRLKMVDKDGKFKYSGVVAVKNGNIRSMEVQVTPNPFTDKIQLQVQSENAGMAKINIRDISGKLIESMSKFIAAGSSVIEINNLLQLQKGIYIVEIEMNGNKQQVKAVK